MNLRTTCAGAVVPLAMMLVGCGSDGRAGAGDKRGAGAWRPGVGSQPAPAPSIALPWEQRIGLEQALAARDPRHAPRMDGGAPVLGGGALVGHFSSRGARLVLGGHEVTLAAIRIGRSGVASRKLASNADPLIAGPEVRLARGRGIVEWWRSLPSGLEHGVTVAERLGGQGELEIEVEAGGDLGVRALSADAIALVTAAGARVATYARLIVLDATGARLPARMAVRDGGIAIAVDDAGARYPIVVDPIVAAEEATLLAPDGAASDSFGRSVALSADGSRALVGAPNDDTAGGADAGSARVFVRSGTTWTEEATLLAAGGTADDVFGPSVALSADGSRALVGAPGDDTAGGAEAGSARVFLRSGTTWTEEATLLDSGGAAYDGFGWSVALSADGSRALVGAPYAANGFGSARVFLRSGTTWTEEATLLDSGGGAIGDGFGLSVALSADGSRALVGAPYDYAAAGGDAGSARVFLRSGTAWTEEAAFLNSASGARFGWSVALSADGSRALVGAPYADSPSSGLFNLGNARVFLRSGTAWTSETTLFGSFGADGDNFGWSVALSGDGSRALVGAPGDDTAAGASAGGARVFLRSGTAWTEEAALLASGGTADDNFGWSVALSGDGSRALVGATGDDTAGGAGAGSARVFTLLFTLLDLNGTTCANGATCASGFCVDGVCCDAACGGTVSTDCQACSTAAGASSNGICTALSGRSCDDGNACTHTDVCSPGSCAGTAITCASDACNTRACNGTATCTVTPLTGTACNDGNACTQTDTCQAGACTGANPIACGGADACHDAVCNPATGACANPNKPNGTPCGSGCASTCQSGTCTAGGSVICSPLDQCHLAGTCDPTTGTCSDPPVANGAACNDGNACTQNDRCQAGVCTGGAPIACTASDECHVAGTCNPATGQCSNPPAANDTPCAGGTCQNGACMRPDGGPGDGGPDAATGAGGRGGGGETGGTGGATGTGAATGAGGAAGTGGGGASGAGGRGGGAGATAARDGGGGAGGAATSAGGGGCGCDVSGGAPGSTAFLLGIGLLLARRSRRPPSPRR